VKIFDGKTVLITGGTGSLGKVFVRRLLSGQEGNPRKIIVFSRDEAKQHFMRVEYMKLNSPTDEVIYNNFRRILEFRIGDVRNYHSVRSAIKDANIIINAAALKQVPSCEYYPAEAVMTNTLGAVNIVTALSEADEKPRTVVGVSTDKACKPVNVMGMSKAIQERVFVAANLSVPHTRFVCVRYGNVLASRGSVIPFFHDQIKTGGPVTITTNEMTRFLLPLSKGVDTIIAAIRHGKPGDTFIPQVPASRIIDVAKVLIGDRPIKIVETGVRPGEKIHEILISDEEACRVEEIDGYYVIRPMLPELLEKPVAKPALLKAYSSEDNLFDLKETLEMLTANKLLIEQCDVQNGEMLV